MSKKLESVKLEAKTFKKDKKLLAIASTQNTDRVGDTLDMADWDLASFKRNPVLQAGHDHNPQFTIGIAKNIRIENTEFGTSLVFEPEFHEYTQLARDIKAMYEGEVLTAWSVGFIPKALMKDEYGNKLGKNELLEISAVAVPANAECITAAKSYTANDIKPVQEWLDAQMKSLEESEEKIEGISSEEKEVIETKEEEPTKEDKGLIADQTVENIRIMEEQRIKEANIEKVRNVYWAFMDVYYRDDIAANMFSSLLLEMSSMIISLANGEEIKSTDNIEIKALTEESIKKIQSFLGIEEKQGKVISKKNADMISGCITSLKDTATGLETLLSSATSSEEETSTEEKQIVDTKSVQETPVLKRVVVKGRETKDAKKLSQDELVLRALKKIAGQASFALNQSKK